MFSQSIKLCFLLDIYKYEIFFTDSSLTQQKEKNNPLSVFFRAVKAEAKLKASAQLVATH